jgi:hypothetical protein
VIAAVTGGRYDDARRPRTLTQHQIDRLLGLVDRLRITKLVHGDAIGYDQHVAHVIKSLRPRIEVNAYRIRHELDGEFPQAGHRRNRRMLRDSKAEVLISLPGSGGTANCTSEALVMGLSVWGWEGTDFAGDFASWAPIPGIHI